MTVTGGTRQQHTQATHAEIGAPLAHAKPQGLRPGLGPSSLWGRHKPLGEGGCRTAPKRSRHNNQIKCHASWFRQACSRLQRRPPCATVASQQGIAASPFLGVSSLNSGRPRRRPFFCLLSRHATKRHTKPPQRTCRPEPHFLAAFFLFDFFSFQTPRKDDNIIATLPALATIRN